MNRENIENLDRYKFGRTEIVRNDNGDWVLFDDVKQAYSRMILLEKVAMLAQEVCHPKGIEPACLTEMAKRDQARRERLSQALNELNKDWGK